MNGIHGVYVKLTDFRNPSPTSCPQKYVTDSIIYINSRADPHPCERIVLKPPKAPPHESKVAQLATAT